MGDLAQRFFGQAGQIAKKAVTVALEAGVAFSESTQEENVQDDPASVTQFNSDVPRSAFDAIFAQRKSDLIGNRNSDAIKFREREVAIGLTPKEQTIATLRIISDLNSQALRTPDSFLAPGGRTIFATDQFILQSATEADQEKIQVVETFGESVIFLYGRRPRYYTFGGLLLNSGNFASDGGKIHFWRDNFKLAYDTFLRGTKSVQFRARAYLTYDHVLREGFIVNSQISQDIRPNMVDFTFTMYITRETNLEGEQAMLDNTVDGRLNPSVPELPSGNPIL